MPENVATKQLPPVHLQVRVELPDKPPREFTCDFRQPVISMGREPTNDVQIPLTTVSRNHARIFFERGDYFLEDLGSTHGTLHNGKKVDKGEKRLLRDGDSIKVVSFSIVFKTTAGTILDRQPGEKTEQLARRMVQEVLSSLGGSKMDPPALRVMTGVDEGKRYEFSDDAQEITIGRSPECDVALDDANVSRRHCLIKRNWHGFTAQDLGSKNGVVVNGKVIQGVQLIKDGDEVQIGGVKLSFIDPASRLLEQMGGPDATMDPEGVGDTDGSGQPDPYQEPEPEPEPELEPPPEDYADPAEAPAASESEVPVAPPVLPPELGDLVGAKKSFPWEVVILVVGGLILLGVVALALFMVL